VNFILPNPRDFVKVNCDNIFKYLSILVKYRHFTPFEGKIMAAKLTKSFAAEVFLSNLCF